MAGAEPVFDVRLDLVEDGREIDRVRRKYRETLSRSHACAHLDVHKVYLLEIGHMKRAFEARGLNVGNVKELWHGSRTSNLLSIMKAGFQIPASNAPHVTGRLFGAGAYFSDQSSKSLNYSFGYWSAGDREDNCFLLLNNVALGKVYEPRSQHETFPKPGFDSTHVRGGTCGVINNETIVYRVDQIDPVLLVNFTRGGR